MSAVTWMTRLPAGEVAAEVVWALCHRLVYRSGDGGSTWQPLSAASPSLRSLAPDAADPDRLVTSWWTSHPGQVQWITGDGRSCRSRAGNPQPSHAGSCP